MITRLRLTECASDPLVAVTVNGYVPMGVLVLVAIVKDEDWPPRIAAGLKLELTPAGNPVTVSVAAPVKPPSAVRLSV